MGQILNQNMNKRPRRPPLWIDSFFLLIFNYNNHDFILCDRSSSEPSVTYGFLPKYYHNSKNQCTEHFSSIRYIGNCNIRIFIMKLTCLVFVSSSEYSVTYGVLPKYCNNFKKQCTEYFNTLRNVGNAIPHIFIMNLAFLVFLSAKRG